DVLPEERSGVGFLMAVFRKRLASSFYALQRSLERRRDLILAIQHDLDTLDEYLEATHRMLEEDEDDDEDDLDVGSMLAGEQQRLLRLYRDPERRTQLEHERLYLQEYITDLGQITVDSKFEVFAQRLQQVLDAGHRVIVFTQYLDTLDFIRERLVSR